MTLELQPDDIVLLCSDGLTGVLEDTVIAQMLATTRDLDASANDLVRMTNEAGGPDNVTVVLLRYEDSATSSGTRTVPIRTQSEPHSDNWADRMGAFGTFVPNRPQIGSDGDGGTSSYSRLVVRWLAIVFGIVVLLALLYAGGRFLLSQSYFVGLEGEEVVIYQGVDMEIGPFDLARVRERTGVMLEDIPAWYHPTLEAGRPAADINDARRIVQGIPQRDNDTS